MKKNRLEKARLTDWQKIWVLETRNFPVEDVFLPRRIRYLLKSPNCHTVVVRSGGMVVASMMVLIRHDSIPRGRIYKIVVDSSARGKGLASMLLRHADGVLRELKIPKVCAEVRKSNLQSVYMFEKHGYRADRILPKYYPNGEDGIKFWKESGL